MFYAKNAYNPRSTKNQIQADLIKPRVLSPFQGRKSVDIRHKVNGSIYLQATPRKDAHNAATFNPIIDLRMGSRVVIDTALSTAEYRESH